MPPLLQPVLPAPDRIPFLQGMDPQNGDALPTLAPVNSMGASSVPMLPSAAGSQVETTGMHDRSLRQNYDEGQLAKLNAPHLGQEGSAHPGVFGKILHGLGQAGGIALTALNPNIAALTPGTQLHNNILRGNLNQDLAQVTQESQAERQGIDADQQAQAQTAYTQQRPQIEQAKLQQKYDIATNKLRELAAAKGQKLIETEDGIRFQDDPTLQALLTQQQTGEMHESTAQKNAVETQLAPRKVDQVDVRNDIGEKNADTNAKRLGLQGQSLNLRGQEFGFNQDKFYNPEPTTDQRNSAGRAAIMQQLGQHLASQLNDPDIRQYLGPGAGRLAEIEGRGGVLPAKIAQFKNDLVSYGAFQAGFHPVKGIGALQYFDHVIGGLGQDPEQLRGKLLSNDSTANLVRQVGSTHSRGQVGQATASSLNTTSAPQSGGNTVTVPDGTTYKFKDAASAANFRKEAGIK